MQAIWGNRLDLQAPTEPLFSNSVSENRPHRRRGSLNTSMKPTKITIPEELKSDLPPSRFGKILSATPVVMAVVATMLAGLASSEMTRAQYDRSLGAQQQSKAGDQWSFFQAKRLRGAFQRNTAELLQAVSEVRPLEAASLRKWAQQE